MWRDFIRQACIYVKEKENINMILRLWCSTTNTIWICKHFVEDDILLIEIPFLGESVVPKTHVSFQFANPFFSTPRYKYVLYKYICNIKWAIWGHCVCEKDWMFEVRSVGRWRLMSTWCQKECRKINLLFSFEFRQLLYQGKLLEQRPDKACGPCGIIGKKCDFHCD